MADDGVAPPPAAEAAAEAEMEVPGSEEATVRAEALQAAKVSIVERINVERTEAGLPPLVFDSNISETADSHCEEMVANAYSSHWNLRKETVPPLL